MLSVVDLDQDWLQLFEHRMSAAEQEHCRDDYDEAALWTSSVVDLGIRTGSTTVICSVQMQ